KLLGLIFFLGLVTLAVLFVDGLSRGEPAARAGASADPTVTTDDELVVEFGLPPEALPERLPGEEGVDYHVVREGETLRGIARLRLGDPNRDVELAALNGLSDPNHIRVGQQLRLR